MTGVFICYQISNSGCLSETDQGNQDAPAEGFSVS